MTPSDAKHAGALVKILKESGLKKADIPKELRQMAKLIGVTTSVVPVAAAKKPAGGLYD